MITRGSKKRLVVLRVSDIRGIAQLATQATEGVTNIAEGVHRSVWNTIGVPGGRAPGQTRGITGLVYKSVHIVTKLVGYGVDKVLARLERGFESEENVEIGTPQREAVLAALNGVVGDRLLVDNNPFATPMTLRYRGEALNWQAMSPMPGATGKVLLLVHGLCMNDLQWRTQYEEKVVDHGEALASALGCTPVYLRYNSGVHTSQNGRELSAELEELATQWPTPIEELTIVAHSMGGLVTRSAIHYAKQESLRWPGHLKNIVFLGTPHHGAPLEQAGNWVDAILGSTPYTAPFARLGQLRSAGITDLRYGHVLDEDWDGLDRFHRTPDNRQVVPLPDGVACYTVAATTAAKRSTLADRLTGDGLVPLNSALGHHDDVRRNLVFAEASQRIFYSMNHTELLSSPEVTRQMVQWLESAKGMSDNRMVR
jgi:pimeloyl-ACP methyl ester carboxylesterase